MSPTFTPFPMYDFPELAEAHDVLWRRFVELARRDGFDGVPALTQICGYPLVTSLRHRFEVIAAPVYDVPFSSRAAHRGLIVVAGDAPYVGLGDLRGTRFALNAWDSNTGMNLPRALFAPFAIGGRFFGSVAVTGSHLESLAAVRLGKADVASIDNVTFALLAEHRPAVVRGLRVLTSTAPSPTIPFVIEASARSPRALLFDALARAVDDVRRPAPRDVLHFVGVERIAIERYEALATLEREATELGYGTLA